MSLGAKQAAFVREYLVDLNATQAAIRAGYSPKTAESQGSRLLRNAKVQAAVAAGQEKAAKRAEISAADVLRELGRLGFSDIAGIFNAEGQLRSFRDIPEDTRRAIAAIKVKSHTEPGDEDVVVYTTEIKLWDKPGALGMLGKHLKLFTEKVEHSFVDLTDEQLEARKQEIAAKWAASTSVVLP